tara:strand:- start:48 stop:341 length:294 start_codon:yes stop_codon:yes gene_type:complete
MKTIQDYQNLKTTLATIGKNHTEKYEGKNSGGYLDATSISIKMNGHWRFKKEVGCERDYDGWKFYSTSANSNGFILYKDILNACQDFGLLSVTERQL